MPRGRVEGPDPRWDGARPFDEPEPPPPGAIPAVLAGSGGNQLPPDPVQITGVRRRVSIDPIELTGGAVSGDIPTNRNAGMPEGGDAFKYPEPPVSPQSAQTIPPMLARPPETQAAIAAGKPKMAKVVAPGQAQTPSRPVLESGSSTSPDFDAFVAQRARQIADLKAAQGTADEARRWQDVANGFVRAGDVSSGRRTDETALQQRLDNTQQPVRNILQQQEAGRAATGEALAQTNLSGKMWEQRMATQAADPNSAISQRTQGFLASTGLFPKGAEKFVSAADYEHALQAGTAGIHSLALKAQIAHQNAELELQKGKAAEDIRHHDQEYDVGMMRMRKDIPPVQEGEIESLLGGADAASELKGIRDNASFTDKVGSWFGQGDYNAAKHALAPRIAGGRTGGKVRPSAEYAELKNLPGPWFDGGSKQLGTTSRDMLRDAEAKLNAAEASRKIDPNKLAELRRQLEEKKAALNDRGVGGIQAHPQDNEAVSWAKANPGDPAAAAILKLNGLH